eukprot:TRINITY_DN11105_c0_g1_i3.p2 TRINITY_DN11105_c0_g1~~TRINITY_DN11105_c0_g1_i3.p2  ORF type:complete len:109 (-),score=6.38 TRINITY_DN11105_c0_g1_i3:276-602(-)
MPSTIASATWMAAASWPRLTSRRQSGLRFTLCMKSAEEDDRIPFFVLQAWERAFRAGPLAVLRSRDCWISMHGERLDLDSNDAAYHDNPIMFAAPTTSAIRTSEQRTC